jgi:hypothetical protein
MIQCTINEHILQYNIVQGSIIEHIIRITTLFSDKILYKIIDVQKK